VASSSQVEFKLYSKLPFSHLAIANYSIKYAESGWAVSGKALQLAVVPELMAHSNPLSYLFQLLTDPKKAYIAYSEIIVMYFSFDYYLLKPLRFKHLS
jgi:hypothetical protein